MPYDVFPGRAGVQFPLKGVRVPAPALASTHQDEARLRRRTLPHGAERAKQFDDVLVGRNPADEQKRGYIALLALCLLLENQRHGLYRFETDLEEFFPVKLAYRKPGQVLGHQAQLKRRRQRAEGHQRRPSPHLARRRYIMIHEHRVWRKAQRPGKPVEAPIVVEQYASAMTACVTPNRQRHRASFLQTGVQSPVPNLGVQPDRVIFAADGGN
jgi:hypothetical protein